MNQAHGPRVQLLRLYCVDVNTGLYQSIDLADLLPMTVVRTGTLEGREPPEVRIKHYRTAQVQILTIFHMKRPFVFGLVQEAGWDLGETECSYSRSPVAW